MTKGRRKFTSNRCCYGALKEKSDITISTYNEAAIYRRVEFTNSNGDGACDKLKIYKFIGLWKREIMIVLITFKWSISRVLIS